MPFRLILAATLTLVILLSSSGCKKSDTIVDAPSVREPVPDTTKPTIYFSMRFGGVVNSDTLFADFAWINIDGLTYANTDSSGQLNISSLVAGTHDVIVKQTYFSTYYGHFLATDSDYVFISLTPTVEEFFPLVVGAQWSYLHCYGDGGGARNQWDSRTDSGITTWTIVKMYRRSLEKVYSVNAQYHKTGGSIDGVSSSQDTFNLVESNNHRITIQANSANPWNYLLFEDAKTVLDQNAVYRYFDKNVADELNFYGDSWLGLHTGGIIFKKNTGLERYVASISGITYGFSDYYNLKSYTIPTP